MKAYLKRDIAKKLGKTPKTIQTWTDIGLVNPDLIPSQGKGISRVYSSLNLLQFAFADELLKCRGMNLTFIKWVMDKLRSETTDETTFKKAIEQNPEGDMLLTSDLVSPDSLRWWRSGSYENPLVHFDQSPATYTINLSLVIESAKKRL